MAVVAGGRGMHGKAVLAGHEALRGGSAMQVGTSLGKAS
jgi:hypothetical protein